MPSDASTKIVLPTALRDSLQARIDEIGFGKFQLLVLCCTGGVMMAEGAEVLIMGSVTTLLDEDWGLSDFIRGFMVSIVFIGFACGNLVSGALGDRYGRRPTILLAYAIIGTMGFLTAVAQHATAMVMLRFCAGVGCGIGFPAIYTLIPEVCPSHLRGAISACMIGFMPLGEIFASLGVLIIDKDLEGLQLNKKFAPLPEDSWRRLCQWSALPSLIFLPLSYLLLCESPFYLASRGRAEEAEALLEHMARWNGEVSQAGASSKLQGASLRQQAGPVAENKLPSAEAVQPSSEFSWFAAVGTCFSSRYWATTAVMVFANFTKYFSVFGLNFVFPQYFQHTAGTLAVGWEMLIISFVALPGVAVAFFVSQSEKIGSIASISLLSFLCGLAGCGLLSFGANSVNSICAYVVKFMALAYFIVTVVYTAEVFPTSIRNTAVGLCTSCGRIGSIVAPLAFELTDGFDFFWSAIIVTMWGVAASSRRFLSLETKGRALAELQASAESVEGYGSTLLDAAKGV